MTRLQTWSLPWRSQDPVRVSSQSKNVDFIDSIEEEFQGTFSIHWTWCQVLPSYTLHKKKWRPSIRTVSDSMTEFMLIAQRIYFAAQWPKTILIHSMILFESVYCHSICDDMELPHTKGHTSNPWNKGAVIIYGLGDSANPKSHRLKIARWAGTGSCSR